MNVSRNYTLVYLFPGAIAPAHVLQTQMVVEPLEVMRDTKLFIDGTLYFAYPAAIDVSTLLQMLTELIVAPPFLDATLQAYIHHEGHALRMSSDLLQDVYANSILGKLGQTAFC